jgi:hypothetical protein
MIKHYLGIFVTIFVALWAMKLLKSAVPSTASFLPV